jgi:hypothetical protein
VIFLPFLLSLLEYDYDGSFEIYIVGIDGMDYIHAGFYEIWMNGMDTLLFEEYGYRMRCDGLSLA